MNRFRKLSKWIVMILAMVLLLSCVGSGVQAAETQKYSDIEKRNKQVQEKYGISYEDIFNQYPDSLNADQNVLSIVTSVGSEAATKISRTDEFFAACMQVISHPGEALGGSLKNIFAQHNVMYDDQVDDLVIEYLNYLFDNEILLSDIAETVGEVYDTFKKENSSEKITEAFNNNNLDFFKNSVYSSAITTEELKSIRDSVLESKNVLEVKMEDNISMAEYYLSLIETYDINYEILKKFHDLIPEGTSLKEALDRYMTNYDTFFLPKLLEHIVDDLVITKLCDALIDEMVTGAGVNMAWKVTKVVIKVLNSIYEKYRPSAYDISEYYILHSFLQSVNNGLIALRNRIQNAGNNVCVDRDLIDQYEFLYKAKIKTMEMYLASAYEITKTSAFAHGENSLQKRINLVKTSLIETYDYDYYIGLCARHALGETISEADFPYYEGFPYDSDEDVAYSRFLSDYTDIYCEYEDDDSSTYFTYSDKMLVEDARQMSPEMAKASVSLAAAAYGDYSVNARNALINMGYGTADIQPYNYTNIPTMNNNDFVAFTIAKKQFEYGGKTYIAYCIPIRGTSGNLEWVSNFNLGDQSENKGYHYGFELAADEVLTKLREQVADDNYDGSKTVIVWLTGHSRGAAVANIVAGKLTDSEDLTTADHIWGYNFACPAVGKCLSTKQQTYSNIYNYNYSGDIVPILPLEKWEYYRYGKNIELDLDELENVKLQYKRKTGDDFVASTDSSDFCRALEELVPNERAYFYPENQVLFTILAWYLCNERLEEFGPKLALPVLQLLGGSAKASDLSVDMEEIKRQYEEALELIDAEEYIDMDAEQFAYFVQQNEEVINRIKNYVKYEINTPQKLKAARSPLVDSYNEGSGSIIRVIDSLAAILWKRNISAVTQIKQAHRPLTYLTWINSMYYGYEGWYKNSKVTDVDIKNGIRIIDCDCFYGCDFLKQVVIPESVRRIGGYSFAECFFIESVMTANDECFICSNAFYESSLGDFEIKAGWELGNNSFESASFNELKIPVDYFYKAENGTPFKNASMEKVHYTVGKTGIMPDRITHYFDEEEKDQYVLCSNALERTCYAYLGNLEFDEGIRYIGNYAFYNPYGGSWMSGGSVKSVVLPSTVEEIGEYAFAYQMNLESIVIPETIKRIPTHCFYECDSLKDVVLPKSVKEIFGGAFGECSSVGNIRIESDDCFIGGNAFYKVPFEDFEIKNGWELGNESFGSASFNELKIPVDYFYKEENGAPFRNASMEKVHYTAGKTGIMPDRVSYYFDEESKDKYVLCSNTLERTCYAYLGNLEFDEGIRYIGKYAFENPYGGSWMYGGSVKRVILPSSVEEIGEYAFANQKNLEYIEFPDTIEKISNYCFYECDALKDVVIPKNVKEIYEGAFRGCSSVGNIKIESDDCFIRSYAFNNVTFGDFEIKSGWVLGNSSFDSASFNELKIPVDYYYKTENGTPFRNARMEKVHYTVGKTGIMPDRIDDVFFEEEEDQYILCENTLEGSCNASLGNLEFDEGIRHIGSYAFYNDNRYGGSVKQVLLPSTVEDIGENAFAYQKNLEYVELPDGIKAIPDRCFIQCLSLNTITIPSCVETIGGDAFSGCENLSFYCRRNSYAADYAKRYKIPCIFETCDVHSIVIDEAVAPTCTTTGLTQGSHCSVCGEVIVAQEVIPMLHSGWVEEGGNRYYYNDNGVMVTGLQKIGGKTYYFAKSGVMKTGWLTSSGKKYYFESDGALVTGVQKIGGKTYYFNSSGVMKTGWLTSGDKKYYFGSDGAMVTGVQKIGSKTYYFNSSGVMKTGWLSSGGKMYYFGTDGAMVIGVQKIGGKTYYFNTSGVMKTGWLTSGDKKYYFGTDGAMVTGAKKIGGKTYFFSTNGVMYTGWKTSGNKRYYFDTDGSMVTGTKEMDGYEYTFAATGVFISRRKLISISSTTNYNNLPKPNNTESEPVNNGDEGVVTNSDSVLQNDTENEVQEQDMSVIQEDTETEVQEQEMSALQKDTENKVQEQNLSSAEIGDTITFGSYEQDNDESNGKEDIEWIVLDKDGDRLLVISKYALDQQVFVDDEDMSWENSAIRTWLNSSFAENAFNAEELEKLPTLTGETNESAIFFLGSDDAMRIFSGERAEVISETDSGYEEARVCAMTEYAKRIKSETASSEEATETTVYEEPVGWWLCMAGNDGMQWIYVGADGCIATDEEVTVGASYMVRPAMWIVP